MIRFGAMQHAVAARGEFADTVVHVDLRRSPVGLRWEVLPARLQGEDRAEVCAIPFLAYDVSLGDVVKVRQKGRRLIVDEVVEWSGHTGMRVWFAEDLDAVERDAVVERLHGLGAETERHGDRLLAVDAADDDIAAALLGALTAQEDAGRLAFETAHTG